MPLSTRKKVLVSGCYDLLHSGHVAFFQEAASFGDLYVALGSDKTIYGIKGRPPINDEAERLFMVRAIGCVTDAFISRGAGMLDFLDLCEERGVQYIVLERAPHPGLVARSTTDLRRVATIGLALKRRLPCFPTWSTRRCWIKSRRTERAPSAGRYPALVVEDT
jgi:cytidyltransferase-like protein